MRTLHDCWQELNQRQQRSLSAIYIIDQQQEQVERLRAKTTRRSRPAAEWRWMRYGFMPLSGNPSPLKAQLLDAQLDDQETGATFATLCERGYILCRNNPSDPTVFIQITLAGRRLVRDALSIKLPKSLPVGGLREWHWRALAAAYSARETGIRSETWWVRESDYGKISYKTWQRLFYYSIHSKEYPLVRVHSGDEIVGYVAQITPWGIAFYERTYNDYHIRYPTIAALEPAEPVSPLEPFIERESGSQSCLVCRGYYLMEITRTYQMQRDGTWKVSEKESRRPGTVESRYKIKQCGCSEAEICEVRASLFEILEFVARQGWCFRFTGHHPWYGDVGNRLRSQSDPLCVMQALQPLYDESLTGRNIVKDVMTYFYNERLGVGNVYAAEPLHRWALARTSAAQALIENTEPQ